MAEVTFSNVGKVFSDGTRAVDGFDVTIADGEFMVLVGPSGCGKTTVLRMLAGLEEVSEGEIRIGDRVVNDLEPRDRGIAMVFQNYALYPHMSVYDNIAFGLRTRRVGRSEVKQKVREAAEKLALTDLLHRKPRTLSGGQRQRVAMGRAIVRDPSAFLMDEPLSNLDAKLRVQMRAEISRIQRNVGATTIYVTHDQVEAMTMGDRVAVMRRGRPQQIGTPAEIYRHPKSLFVASFVGSPSMNVVRARLERSGQHDGLDCFVGAQCLSLPPGIVHDSIALSLSEPHVAVGIRPEDIREADRAQPDDVCLSGRVILAEALGFEVLVHAELDAPAVATEDLVEIARDIDVAAASELEADANAGHSTFVARFGADTQYRSGDGVKLYFDPSRLHFFDLETGTSLAAKV